MAGLLDSDQFRMGLGLLAAAAPRSDGAGLGQRLAEGVGSFDAYKQNALKQKMLEAQMQEHLQAQQQAKALRELSAKFAMPGKPALAPLMGDAESGILPSAGREAVAPSYDYAGFANAVAGIDPMKAMTINAALKKESPKFSTAPQYDQQGNAFILAENGEMKYLSGVKARDKLEEVRLGDKVAFRSPYSTEMQGSMPIGQSPDGKASNALGWANNALSAQGQQLTNQRAIDRLNFDKQEGAESVKPKLVDGQWVTAPSNMKAGEVRPAMPSAGRKDANEALELIKTAREIIPKSTGSYIGTGVDQAARLFGASTGGDTAAAQLKALEGALVSKMPKMSGPQSDKDVLLYKQMAGEIGDPTIPGSRKLAALKVIEEIQQRQAGGGSGASGTWAAPTPPAAGGGWSIQKVN